MAGIDVTSLTVNGAGMQQLMVPQTALPEWILVSGEWVKVFANKEAIPAGYASTKVAIPVSALSENVKGGAKSVTFSGDYNQQQLTPLVTFVLAVIVIGLVAGLIAYGIFSMTRPTHQDVDNRIVCEGENCYFYDPKTGDVTASAPTIPGAPGLPPVGDIITYGLIGLVAIGVGYVGFKAYQSAKERKPLRETAREVGAAMVGPFKGAASAIKQAQ